MNKLVKKRMEQDVLEGGPSVRPQVFWNCLSSKGFSGYSRISREMMLRLPNSVKVQLAETPCAGEEEFDSYFTERLEPLKEIAVSGRAPIQGTPASTCN